MVGVCVVMGSATMVRTAGTPGGKVIASVYRVFHDAVYSVVVEMETSEGV